MVVPPSVLTGVEHGTYVVMTVVSVVVTTCVDVDVVDMLGFVMVGMCDPDGNPVMEDGVPLREGPWTEPDE